MWRSFPTEPRSAARRVEAGGATAEMAKRVLVVDDEPDILELTRFALSQEGFQVETAATGDEALTSMRRSRPDLVVLDLMLPDRPGTEICRWIRSTADLA